MKADQICYWSTSLLALEVGDLRAFILFLPICLVVKIIFAIFATERDIDICCSPKYIG